jgi:hypothetical protein
MKGCSELVDTGPHGRKVGKLLRKNMRKPHFRGLEGRKVTNRPRAVGVPVSFAPRSGSRIEGGGGKSLHFAGLVLLFSCLLVSVFLFVAFVKMFSNSWPLGMCS